MAKTDEELFQKLLFVKKGTIADRLIFPLEDEIRPVWEGPISTDNSPTCHRLLKLQVARIFLLC